MPQPADQRIERGREKGRQCVGFRPRGEVAGAAAAGRGAGSATGDTVRQGGGHSRCGRRARVIPGPSRRGGFACGGACRNDGTAGLQRRAAPRRWQIRRGGPGGLLPLPRPRGCSHPPPLPSLMLRVARLMTPSSPLPPPITHHLRGSTSAAPEADARRCGRQSAALQPPGAESDLGHVFRLGFRPPPGSPPRRRPGYAAKRDSTPARLPAALPPPPADHPPAHRGLLAAGLRGHGAGRAGRAAPARRRRERAGALRRRERPDRDGGGGGGPHRRHPRPDHLGPPVMPPDAALPSSPVVPAPPAAAAPMIVLARNRCRRRDPA